jgi:hypothetical protein
MGQRCEWENKKAHQRLDLSFDVDFSESFGSGTFKKLASLATQKNNAV